MKCSGCGSRKIHTAPELYPGGIEGGPRQYRWLSEIERDGYHVQAHLERGRARPFTRRGYEWTPRFAALAGALTDLPAKGLVLDGEVIAQHETGVADFDALSDLASGRSERMVYFAFDLTHLDGLDLRNAPLIKRKRILAALLEEAKSNCFHSFSTPALVFEQACALGFEGIVCKLRDRALSVGSPRELAQDQVLQARGLPDHRFHPCRRSRRRTWRDARGRHSPMPVGPGTGLMQKSARGLCHVLDAVATNRPPVACRRF
jgi:bifunctional non-homologous end joining protein LigD